MTWHLKISSHWGFPAHGLQLLVWRILSHSFSAKSNFPKVSRINVREKSSALVNWGVTGLPNHTINPNTVWTWNHNFFWKVVLSYFSIAILIYTMPHLDFYNNNKQKSQSRLWHLVKTKWITFIMYAHINSKNLKILNLFGLL